METIEYQQLEIPGPDKSAMEMWDQAIKAANATLGYPAELLPASRHPTMREVIYQRWVLDGPQEKWRQVFNETVRKVAQEMLGRLCDHLMLHRTIPKGLVRRHGLKKALQVWPRRARLKAWRRAWGRGPAALWDFQEPIPEWARPKTGTIPREV
jgi:hypothetical protein